MPHKSLYLDKTLDKKVKKFAKERNLAIATALRVLVKIGLLTANDERDINQMEKAMNFFKSKWAKLQGKVDDL